MKINNKEMKYTHYDKRWWGFWRKVKQRRQIEIVARAGVTILSKVIRRGLTDRVTFELRPEREIGSKLHSPDRRILVKWNIAYLHQDQCLLLTVTRREGEISNCWSWMDTMSKTCTCVLFTKLRCVVHSWYKSKPSPI